jgi:holo-[acyl-carrier protein] synthase
MIVGIGVDAVEIARIARALERHARFAERVFTEAERDASARRGAGAAAYLAKRWAAKEAVSKALGVGFSGFHYTDLEVTNHPSGAPSIALGGELAEWARELGVTSWHLSLSDTRDTAVAAVVAEGEQPRRPGGPPPWVRRRLDRQRAAGRAQGAPVAARGPGGSRSEAKPGPQQRAADTAAVGLPTGQSAVAPRLDKGVDR